MFHLVGGKLLFIMKSSIPDLDTAVIFLTGRLSRSDVDDWGELRRILRFFHCTLKEKRCFGATNLDEIFTWVGASYSVHHDMKSHTRGVIYMGLGVAHCRSSKKKLNTKSSTES